MVFNTKLVSWRILIFKLSKTLEWSKTLYTALLQRQIYFLNSIPLAQLNKDGLLHRLIVRV